MLSPFYVPDGHLYFFFGKNIYSDHLPIVKWMVCFVLFYSHWVLWVILLFWILTPHQIWFASTYHLLFSKFTFHFTDSFFVLQNFLTWCCPNCLYFASISFPCAVKSKKKSSPTMMSRRLLHVTFRSIMISGLQFKVLIHFWVGFYVWCKIRVWFYFLNVAVHFYKHLLEKLSLPRCIYLTLWASLVAQSVKKICLQYGGPEYNLWVKKIPWRKEWHPAVVFLPGQFHGEKSLAGHRSWGCKELDMTEQLILSLVCN